MRIRELFDLKLLKFLLVGAGNTILSAVIMFLLYNLLSFGYWGASAVSYLAGAIFSFFLNRKFTFRNSEVLWKSCLKFALTVAVCYLLAYSAAQPLVLLMLRETGLELPVMEQIAMLFGMVLYTGLNYLGQRLFAFREKND